MTDERDFFLAEQLGRITPPAHRPDFWADLEETLAMTTPSDSDMPAGDRHIVDGPDTVRPVRPEPRKVWQRPGFLAAAAAVLLIVGVVAGLSLGGDDGDTSIADDATPIAVDEPTAGPTTEPTAGPDEPTVEPTAAPTEPAGDVLDLTDAAEVGTSADGALRLFALPTVQELGCEGGPSYELYWVGDDGAGTAASPQLFFNVPRFTQGPGGQVTFLAGCEEQTSQLLLGVEDPAGTLGPLVVFGPVGWENAAVQSVSWGDNGNLIAQASRMDALSTTSWTLLIDPATGELIQATPAGEAECSANEVTDATFRPLDGVDTWSGLANAIQAAALSCDFEAVAALAADPFTFSFGGGDDFAGFLRDAEDGGGDPMAKLVRLLQAAPGTPLDDDTRITWPAFFACEATCGMDTDEVLRLGYTREDITGFEQFGGYLGYRMSFVQVPNADGSDLWEWQYFVAGD